MPNETYTKSLSNLDMFRQMIKQYDSFSELCFPNCDIDIYRNAGDITAALQGLGYPPSTPWSISLKYKHILDLGCGSELTPRTMHPLGWIPLFSRICALKGAYVVGIDVYPSIHGDKELYTHITQDIAQLMVEGSDISEITGLTEGTIDIIHASMFTDAPNLYEGTGKFWYIEDQFHPWLIEQVTSNLKDGGIFQTERYTYRKQNNQLKVLTP